MSQLNNSNIEPSQIIKIIQQIIGNDVVINIDSNKINTKNWDSLTHLNLIIELENAFDLSFTMEEMEKMISVNVIIEIINNK
ncbi:MAG: acyl carrier protein [Bacteroidetes bacterium]|nr:acyl carrier protein [Bacteroidota bacterium]